MENLQVRSRTRSGKLLGSTVVTKKVVRETVEEVVITPFDSSKENNINNQVELQVISTSTKENEKVQVINSSKPGKSPLRKISIVFGVETDDQEAPPPPEERRKKEQWRKEEHDNEIEKQQTRDYIQDSENQQAVDQTEEKRMDMEDEDETQPASEADVPPPPPPPPEKEMIQEEDDEWFDVENEVQKEPEAEEEEERMEAEEEREAEKEEETRQELSTPPRYEAPQKKEELETDKKKRKASGGAQKGGGRKRSRRRVGRDIAADYKTYIYRVLKQVHPDLGITSKGMATINSFLNGMYEKIADEAGKLSRYTGGKTLSVRDIQDAVKLVLPGDLGKHAMAEGTKAVSRYATHTWKGRAS